MNNKQKTIANLCLLAITIFLLSGCKSLETHYRGYTSENSSNSALVDGSTQTGSWETFDLLLAYQAEKRNDQLDITGSVSFGNYFQMNATRIEGLNIFLFFIDKDAKVLETTRLSSSLEVGPKEVINFNRTLQIPPNAEAISFGYDGQYRSSGRRRGGGVTWFNNLPKRPAR